MRRIPSFVRAVDALVRVLFVSRVALPTRIVCLLATTTSASATTSISGTTLIASSDAVFGTAPGTATAGSITFGSGGILDATGSFTLDSRRGILLSTGGGVFQIDPSVTLTYDGILAGFGGITKTGTGTLILSGLNTQTNGTTVSAGTLTISSTGLLGGATTSLTIAAGATVNFLNAAQTVSGFSGGGTLSLGSGHVFTTTVSSGTFSGNLAGSGTFAFGGTALTLSGDNSGFTGAIAVTSASSHLTLSNANALGSTSAGTTVSAGALELAGIALGAEPLTISGTGASAGNAGALTATGTSSASGPITLAGNASIGAGTNAQLTLTGVIGESTANSALTKTASGTLILTGNNTYTGTTTVANGILQIGATGNSANSPLGTTAGATIVAATGGLDLNGFTLAAAEPLTISGFGKGTSHGAVTNSSTTAVNYSGVVTLAAASSIGGIGDITLLSGIAGAFALTKEQFNTLTLTAASTRNSAAGATTLSDGTLKLTVAAALNTNIAGKLTLDGGTLQLAPANDLATTFTGTTTTIDWPSTIISDRSTAGVGLLHTLNSLKFVDAETLSVATGPHVTSGTAGIAFGATTLAADGTEFSTGAGASLTLGALGGDFDFSKSGAGDLILVAQAATTRTSANAALDAGTLRLAIGTALGRAGSAGTLTLNGGTLQLAPTTNLATTFISTATLLDAAATIISDRATAGPGLIHTLGTLSMDAAMLSIAAGSNVTSGTGEIVFGATTFIASGGGFDVASGSALTLGAISGSFGYTKTGAGILKLIGAGTYTGVTAINAGTVFANNSSGSATGTGAVNIANGATLGGSGTIGGLATFARGAHLAPGNSPGTITFSNSLTLTGGAILDFQLGTTSDLIRITGGTLTGPGGAGLITFNLSDAGGFHAGTYPVLNYTTASGTTGFGASDFTMGTSIAGYSYNFSIANNTLQLTASAIPEPATYAALAGVCALGLAAWRRRRRQL